MLLAEAAGSATEDELLKSLLLYRNDEVISSFCDSIAVEREEAQIIFVEMLKFLWLCHVERDRALRTIDNPIIILDEMWHAFILFTKEYHIFSKRYFGKYMHHAPTTSTERQKAMKPRSPQQQTQLLQEQRARYSCIYDRLGRETFITWFHQFPMKYPAARILELRKK